MGSVCTPPTSWSGTFMAIPKYGYWPRSNSRRRWQTTWPHAVSHSSSTHPAGKNRASFVSREYKRTATRAASSIICRRGRCWRPRNSCTARRRRVSASRLAAPRSRSAMAYRLVFSSALPSWCARYAQSLPSGGEEITGCRTCPGPPSREHVCRDQAALAKSAGRACEFSTWSTAWTSDCTSGAIE